MTFGRMRALGAIGAALCALGAGTALADDGPGPCSAVDQVGAWQVRVVEGAAGGSILLSRQEAGAAVEFRRDAAGGLGDSVVLLATGDHKLEPGADAGYRLVVDIDGAPLVATGAMPEGARVYPALIALPPQDGIKLLNGFRAGDRMKFTAQTTGPGGSVRDVVAKQSLDLAGSAAALRAGQARSQQLVAGRRKGGCP
ncbi:hypothetical protein ACQ5SO_09600 [Rhodovulum sp. DZ06]|uniref:hypothetical protein n=1 Tax=Rhodovulum sp. DZ06 TaxID=3425126 RepID=UPI003D32FA71